MRRLQIPDIDTLHADLTGLKYSYDSNTRLRLERKEDMKKRGLRSPDEADALALTFAFPFTTQNVISGRTGTRAPRVDSGSGLVVAGRLR